MLMDGIESVYQIDDLLDEINKNLFDKNFFMEFKD